MSLGKRLLFSEPSLTKWQHDIYLGFLGAKQTEIYLSLLSLSVERGEKKKLFQDMKVPELFSQHIFSTD